MKDKEIQEKANISLESKNNKKARSLKEKGITLIALVVTIIILLILLGVTISQISGENGLFQRIRQTVEKYKNASEEEQIQIGILEQYVSDFEIVGENKSLVSIKEKGLEITTDAEHNQIIVKVTVIGESTGVEYKINSEDNWTEKDTNGVKKETDNETEYTHTFGELALGKSYYIRVKVYDTNNNYIEAISDSVILSNIMTAEDEDVLETKTYLAQDGTLRKGTMSNKGEANETLDAGKEFTIKPGYYSGGKISAKDLASQTIGDATEGEILIGKHAYVNGNQITGSMTDNGPINEIISDGESVTIPAGYTSGGTVTATGVAIGTIDFSKPTDAIYDCLHNGDYDYQDKTNTAKAPYNGVVVIGAGITNTNCYTYIYINDKQVYYNYAQIDATSRAFYVEKGDTIKVRQVCSKSDRCHAARCLRVTFYPYISEE